VSAPRAGPVGRWAGRRHIGCCGVELPAYQTMLYLGCTTGVLVGAVVAGSSGLEPARVALATIVLLIPALAGARLWFVLERWSVYRREPRRVWRRSEGGSALHGGLLLSLVVSVPVLALFGLPFWAFWDVASFTMLIGLVFTRVGCFMNGCCAGRPTASPVGVWLPDRNGIWERRIPVPLLEAGWAGLALAEAVILHAVRPPAGTVLLGVLAVYGLGRLVLEPTRATAGSGGSRANIVLSVVLCVVGAVGLLAAAHLAG
jgi:phosphatidylglycerol:prolipoprotein diacylglycerol transferase